MRTVGAAEELTEDEPGGFAGFGASLVEHSSQLDGGLAHNAGGLRGHGVLTARMQIGSARVRSKADFESRILTSFCSDLGRDSVFSACRASSGYALGVPIALLDTVSCTAGVRARQR